MDPTVRMHAKPIDIEECIMGTAIIAGLRSRDPKTTVGACIVDKDNRIVGVGYNCMPRGRDACGTFSWTNDDNDPMNSKRMYVCHAELNAIRNANRSDFTGCRIYVTLFPCNECAKLISQFGIEEVIYYSNKYAARDEFKASAKILDNIGVTYRQFIKPFLTNDPVFRFSTETNE